MMVSVGKKVAAFEAISTGGTVTLAQFKGSQLVLYFYPKDNTPGCTQEAAEFSEQFKHFKKTNTIIIGVSRDSLKSHENFKKKLELPFDLIADPDEHLCLAFEVMKMKNMYGKQVRGIERSTFLIDTDGKLKQEWRAVKVADHVSSVLAAAKATTV
jgi:thioredoxin-dependent peroxiredoxin